MSFTILRFVALGPNDKTGIGKVVGREIDMADVGDFVEQVLAQTSDPDEDELFNRPTLRVEVRTA